MQTQSVRIIRVENGAIYFSVTTNGWSGKQWITYFEKKSVNVSEWAKEVLLSPEFKPTQGLTFKVAVLPGSMFEDPNREYDFIRAWAKKHNLEKPAVEIGCLIRDMFTDKEIREIMELGWINTMHEPITTSAGYHVLLSTLRADRGSRLSAGDTDPRCLLGSRVGFAFINPQATSA